MCPSASAAGSSCPHSTCSPRSEFIRDRSGGSALVSSWEVDRGGGTMDGLRNSGHSRIRAKAGDQPWRWRSTLAGALPALPGPVGAGSKLGRFEAWKLNRHSARSSRACSGAGVLRGGPISPPVWWRGRAAGVARARGVLRPVGRLALGLGARRPRRRRCSVDVSQPRAASRSARCPRSGMGGARVGGGGFHFGAFRLRLRQGDASPTRAKRRADQAPWNSAKTWLTSPQTL